MTAACIAYHREQMLPLKAIYLKPSLYNKFKAWTEANLNRSLEEGEQMECDTVKIEKASILQVTELSVEFWENVTA